MPVHPIELFTPDTPQPLAPGAARYSPNNAISALFLRSIPPSTTIVFSGSARDQLALAIQERAALRENVRIVRSDLSYARRDFFAKVADLQAALATSDDTINHAVSALLKAQRDLNEAKTSTHITTLEALIQDTHVKVAQAKETHTHVALSLEQTRTDFTATEADLLARLEKTEADLAAKEAQIASLEQAIANEQNKTSDTTHTPNTSQGRHVYTPPPSTKRAREEERASNNFLSQENAKAAEDQAAKASAKKRRIEEKKRIIAAQILVQGIREGEQRTDYVREANAKS